MPTAPLQNVKTPEQGHLFVVSFLLVVTCNALGQDPGGQAVLDSATKWSNDLQHTTLTLTGLDEWSDRSDLIHEVVVSRPNIYMFSPDYFSICTCCKLPILFMLEILESGG